MLATRTIFAMSTLLERRVTTTLAIPMGSPRILEAVCGASNLVHKLGLDLVALIG
jgi:hypothetical protein